MNIPYHMNENNPLDFLMNSPAGNLMEEGPMFKGEDIFQKDIKCSHCGYFIAQKIKYKKIKSLVKYCPRCGTLYQHLE